MRDHGQTPPAARAQVLQHALHSRFCRECPLAGREARDQGLALRDDVYRRGVKRQVRLLHPLLAHSVPTPHLQVRRLRRAWKFGSV